MSIFDFPGASGATLTGSNYAYGFAVPRHVPTTWLDYTADEYDKNVAQWLYARDHYTGECTLPWKVPLYLVRKKIGETIEAYQERVLLADYTPHFGSVVDTLAGMMSQVEPDNNRTFGDALGDPGDPTTVAGRLYSDADGDRTSWVTLFSNLLPTDLTAVHDAWLLVDGGADGRSYHVRLIPAEAVTNWRYERGVLVEALLCEHVDTRAALTDSPDEKIEQQWVRYDVTGWERFRKRNAASKDDQVQSIDKGAYAYRTRAGVPTLPLFRVRLPLRRNVGYLMARKANAVFNKESERDHLMRFATFPLLNIVASDVVYKKILAILRDGGRVLQVPPGGTPHSFIAPPTGALAEMGAAIRQKVEDYYITAFREFGTSARANRDRVTATEIKQEIATGIAAFLGLLKGAVDNAENAAMYLLEQTVFPGDEARWGLASVERTNDFAPFDANAVIQRLSDRYIGAGQTIPIGPTATLEVVKQIMEWDGLDFNEAEVKAEIAKREAAAALALAPKPAGPPKAGGAPGNPDESKLSAGEKQVNQGNL